MTTLHGLPQAITPSGISLVTIDPPLFVIGEKSTISELKRGITLVNEMVEKYQNKVREEREDN